MVCEYDTLLQLFCELGLDNMSAPSLEYTLCRSHFFGVVVWQVPTSLPTEAPVI